MEIIGAEGRGVIVLIREPHPKALSARVHQKLDRPSSHPASQQLRDYGVGAQILLDLGITEMELLSNTDKTIIGLEGYGLTVVGRRPIGE